MATSIVSRTPSGHRVPRAALPREHAMWRSPAPERGPTVLPTPYCPATRYARPAIKSCDLPELCDGASGLCPEDIGKGPAADCILSPNDIGAAEVACLNKNGQCDSDGHCRPVPLTGSICVPSDLGAHDLPCVKSSACDAAGQCQADFLADGEQCGNFCDNSSCLAHACVVNPSPHPCGSPQFCNPNPTTPGKECIDCGDGILQPWEGEECDDGNNKDGDGCTAHCKFSCDPQDPVGILRTADAPSWGARPVPTKRMSTSPSQPQHRHRGLCVRHGRRFSRRL